MKKHILGLTVFCFIFTAFAVTFSVFSKFAMPQILEVKQGFCNKQPIVIYGKASGFRSSRKQLFSAEIVNSIYNEYKGEIISEVKLVWNGIEEPPKKLRLTMTYFTAINSKGGCFNDVQVLDNPFGESSEKIFTVSKNVSDVKIETPDNLYASFMVDDLLNNEGGAKNITFSKKKEVVTIHGN